MILRKDLQKKAASFELSKTERIIRSSKEKSKKWEEKTNKFFTLFFGSIGIFTALEMAGIETSWNSATALIPIHHSLFGSSSFSVRTWTQWNQHEYEMNGKPALKWEITMPLQMKNWQMT